MTTQLREELDALARTQTFSPDPSAWDRGRRARRTSRVVRGAAAVAVMAAAVGAGTLSLRPDATGPAGGVVPEGALPRVVPRVEGDVLTDLAIGRASVAYVDESAQPVLVDATTGTANEVELPDFPTAEVFDLSADVRVGPWLALSPDGTRLAYPTATIVDDPGRPRSFQVAWFRVVDLTTGESELVDLPECGPTPRAMTWTPDGGIAIDAMGRPSFEESNPGVVSCTVDPVAGSSGSKALLGVTAPGGGVSATFPGSDVRYEDLVEGRAPDPDAVVDAVPFVTSSREDLDRPLPSDTYRSGATVLPIGWADNSLLVAQVGSDVVLLTSPDRPDSEWLWRTVISDVPVSEGGLSIAVDLVPDLTGDPDQELTHDFGS
jgi:hypothetical protein